MLYLYRIEANSFSVVCQIKIRPDFEYKTTEYVTGDDSSIIFISRSGIQEVPVITNGFQSPDSEMSVYVNSNSHLFNFIIRPVNPCVDEFANSVCPSPTMICTGKNYEEVTCSCSVWPGLTEVDRLDKYTPICGKILMVEERKIAKKFFG